MQYPETLHTLELFIGVHQLHISDKTLKGLVEFMHSFKF